MVLRDALYGVLGEGASCRSTWTAHWGRHAVEATRALYEIVRYA